MYSKVSKILNGANNFLLPALCFGCNAHLYRGESLLCAFCRHDLPLTEYSFGEENPVDRIFYGEEAVKKAWALLQYKAGGMVQHLVHQLKYQEREGIGRAFGAWMGEALLRDPFCPSFDFIVPVPLHWRRLLHRGYNQCHGMARALAGTTGGHYAPGLLVRERFRRTQTRKGRRGRHAGTTGVFRLRGRELPRGARVLLVDDVITTGATLRACCQAFEAEGGISLYIAALAAVP